MPPPYRKLSSTGIATTFDLIGDDLLQIIISKLPALSFASAACVNHSWNVICDRILCRPKLSSAWSINPSLQVAVEDVANKVLSKPIRPHFAIAFVGLFNMQETHQLITAKLGFEVPVITSRSCGIMARDAVSDEYNEMRREPSTNNGDDDTSVLACEISSSGIMLVVGFLPGIKVKIISLQKKFKTPHFVMIDKFVTEIKEFSTSISGCASPAAIIMFSEILQDTTTIMEKMDYAMSPETAIVGGCGPLCQHAGGTSRNITATKEYAFAAALVFVVDKNKPPGIGETQFHAVMSSGLLALGRIYEVTSVKAGDYKSSTFLTARRAWSQHENLSGETILNEVYEDARVDRNNFDPLCIGVTRDRKCSIGQEKFGWVTSFAFRHVLRSDQEGLTVSDIGIKAGDLGIKAGDTFRFYGPDFTTALSSAANVSNHLKSLKQGSTRSSDKLEVFGGIFFTPSAFGESFFTQPNVGRSPFLDNFPGATLGGTVCSKVLGRCCLRQSNVVYLIMSYTP